MQITGLPRNFYRLYSYHKHHEVKDPHPYLEKYGKKYIECVEKWENLRDEGVSIWTCQSIVGISQATYYRYKQKIRNLSKGVPLPSKRPKKLRESKVSEVIIKKVFEFRKQNSTYGKDKITILLRRDHDIHIGFSAVGKIIKKLKEQGKITKSRSALRPKRKRNFKSHAQRWMYGMKGEN
jgi:transposase